MITNVTSITNVTGADLVGALGQALQPIQGYVIGNSGGLQYISGLLVILIIGGVLAERRASMELMATVLLPTAIILGIIGMLPLFVAVVALFLGAGLIGLAFIKFRQG